MERRVIKFNLMTAILVSILIILAIIGIIAFVVNKSAGKDNGKKGNNQNQTQQQIQDNKESYNELDVKETIDVNGQDVEITMKSFVSELKYKMNYAAEKFYFEGNREFKDTFKSLESDTILLEITKNDEGFKAKSDDLVSGQKERIKANDTYRSNAVEINGKICPIEQEQRNDGFHFSYYIPIENTDGYYTVNVKCDKQFKDITISVVDKMLESFEIM